MLRKNGTFYEGIVVDNKFEGYGRIILTDGEAYECEIKENRAKGKGMKLLKDGRILGGNFVENLLTN